MRLCIQEHGVKAAEIKAVLGVRRCRHGLDFFDVMDSRFSFSRGYCWLNYSGPGLRLSGGSIDLAVQFLPLVI